MWDYLCMKKESSKANSAGSGRLAVAVAAYDGADLLDMSGPIEVFSMLNQCMADAGEPDSGYDIALYAREPGPFASSSGVRLVADGSWRDAPPETLDTVVAVGGPDAPLERAMEQRELLEWLKAAATRARRLVSVCTGAFLLAEAGLLERRQVTTHWMDLDRLRSQYPNLVVETDAIYVRDGSVATSAGVTAGMDLALALVEEDFGRKAALKVARRLVMYLKRPGGQAQFSTQLRAQMVEGGPLASLLGELRKDPKSEVSVEKLASRAAMSPRNFARVFLRETGTTPARYLDQLRLEHAMRLLEDGKLAIGSVALESGFTCAEQMRRTFIKLTGITPIGYRQRF